MWKTWLPSFERARRSEEVPVRDRPRTRSLIGFVRGRVVSFIVLSVVEDDVLILTSAEATMKLQVAAVCYRASEQT